MSASSKPVASSPTETRVASGEPVLLLPPDSAQIDLSDISAQRSAESEFDEEENEESKLLESAYDSRPRRRSMTSSMANSGATPMRATKKQQSFADALFGRGLTLGDDENTQDDELTHRHHHHHAEDDSADDNDDNDEDESTDTATVSGSSDTSAANWVGEMAAKLSLLRENEDDLQVLLMGRGPNIEPLTLDAAVALCRRARSHKLADNTPHLWIDFCNHSARDVEQVRRALAIHPVTVEDCVLVSREKCESFRRYTVVVISEQYYRHNSIVIDTAQTTVLVFQHVTLSFRTVTTSPSFLPVAYRLLHGENKGTIPSAHWVMYAFLDEVVARFDVFTEQIVNEVTVLDDLVLQYARSEQNDLLRRINIARRRLATLQGTLQLKRGVLEALCKSSMLSQDAIGSYLRDVLDECAAMMERLVVTFEVLNHLDSIYMTRLSLEVAQSGESMNVVMKKFSAVATIFLPLSTLAGIFGMNVQVPGQGDLEPTYWWFIGIIVCMVVSSVLVLWYFVRNDFW
jgi:Mg2+ and Co2+ transporter CorA